MAKTSTGRELPKTATNTAAKAMPGKDMMMSSTRISTSETALPAVAAMDPNTEAATIAAAVAHRPITSDDRAP